MVNIKDEPQRFFVSQSTLFRGWFGPIRAKNPWEAGRGGQRQNHKKQLECGSYGDRKA